MPPLGAPISRLGAMGGDEGSATALAQTEYDEQAAAYRIAKSAGWRTCLETASLRRLLEECGGIATKRVLDLGCGEGIDSRWLRREMGAGAVHAVDLSTSMIDLAVQEEARHCLGITYEACDAAVWRRGDALPPFDSVLCAYLLGYASSAHPGRAGSDRLRGLRGPQPRCQTRGRMS